MKDEDGKMKGTRNKLTPALIVNGLALVLIDIHEETREVCTTALLPAFEKFPGGLEEDIYGDVVLSRLVVS